MPAPFTIRIFVPDGDPEGVRIIGRRGGFFRWTWLFSIRWRRRSSFFVER
jgi:hypothetical protein